MNTKQRRAAPLAAGDRRGAIVEAVTPLLLEKGSNVTTREMAEAAGIAEGTIFGVFADKTSVIVESVKAGMDPTRVCEALAQIPDTGSMEGQIDQAVNLLIAWSDRVTALVGVLRSMGPHKQHRPAQGRRFVMQVRERILDALTELLERHTDRLRVDPSRAAIALQGFVLASAHPMAASGDRLNPAEIVDMLVAGIALPHDGDR